MTEAELRDSFRRRRQRILHPPPNQAPAVMDVVDGGEGASPEDRKQVLAAVASRAVAMRMLGFSTEDIALELRIEKPKVERWLMQARKQGALSDVGDQLQYRAAAAAVDKLVAMIEAGDKDAVLDTLKGLGYLRNFSESKHDGRADGPINLQVNVELPTGVRSVSDIPIHGQIAGRARELDDGKEADAREGSDDPA